LRQAKFADAVAEARETIRLDVNDPFILTNIAGLLATHRDPSLRNGKEAVEFARRAAQVTGGRDPAILEILAAAYAEAGRFSDALLTAHQALEIALRQGNQVLAHHLQSQIAQYEAGKPLHP
jgi:hypothetical protein